VELETIIKGALDKSYAHTSSGETNKRGKFPGTACLFADTWGIHHFWLMRNAMHSAQEARPNPQKFPAPPQQGGSADLNPFFLENIFFSNTQCVSLY